MFSQSKAITLPNVTSIFLSFVKLIEHINSCLR